MEAQHPRGVCGGGPYGYESTTRVLRVVITRHRQPPPAHPVKLRKALVEGARRVGEGSEKGLGAAATVLILSKTAAAAVASNQRPTISNTLFPGKLRPKRDGEGERMTFAISRDFLLLRLPR